MSRTAVFVALALLWTGVAAAQTPVYRCGADGSSYSQEPCARGQTIDVADPRSAQQASQARQAASREARQADELERDRLRAERLAAGQGAALIGWSRPAAAHCATGARCTHGETSKRRAQKTHTVTLYRGAAAR
jgi:hypothetical protein